MKPKQLLAEEFKSLGFISDHPLNEYDDIFNHLKVVPYHDFYNHEKINESLVAGTIMSIQEKSAKGTPYAIIKFSDKNGEFELFLFAENLIKNRNLLKESESFVLTLQKENVLGDISKKESI